MENIKYRSESLKTYFSNNRVRWDQFYESERRVIENIWAEKDPAILDIGCGCGGLGLALQEHFGACHYTGIEINDQAAGYAASLNPKAKIYNNDFLDIDESELRPESFDFVFSLSCIDWQLNLDVMLKKAWSMTKPGGYFVASFRLTQEASVNDAKRSYQFINFEGKMEGEIAPYVVLNAKDLMGMIRRLGAVYVYAYGYYGAPSATAVTPFKKLCFGVFAIQKPSNDIGSDSLLADLELPLEFRASMLELLADDTLAQLYKTPEIN